METARKPATTTHDDVRRAPLRRVAPLFEAHTSAHGAAQTPSLFLRPMHAPFMLKVSSQDTLSPRLRAGHTDRERREPRERLPTPDDDAPVIYGAGERVGRAGAQAVPPPSSASGSDRDPENASCCCSPGRRLRAPEKCDPRAVGRARKRGLRSSLRRSSRVGAKQPVTAVSWTSSSSGCIASRCCGRASVA